MRVVLNADDFGYSKDTVSATVDCFEAGLLTSATIMARMPATIEALEYARSRRDLSFGVHLTFTGDGAERPVADAARVASLVDANGCFRRGRDVRLRALLGRLDVDEISTEIAAQIETVRAAGVPVTHVDSHRHLHKFAPFLIALSRTLPKFGIRRVRTVQDLYLRRPLTSPTYLLGARWRRRLVAHFITTDHFYMPTSAGDRHWDQLAGRLSALPGQTLEVGLHPGYAEQWRRRESQSLQSFVRVAAENGETLVTWAELAGH